MYKLQPHWQALKKQYKLTEILGKGTFGEVVKGQNRQTKQICAIKCLKIDETNCNSLVYIIREL